MKIKHFKLLHCDILADFGHFVGVGGEILYNIYFNHNHSHNHNHNHNHCHSDNPRYRNLQRWLNDTSDAFDANGISRMKNGMDSGLSNSGCNNNNNNNNNSNNNDSDNGDNINNTFSSSSKAIDCVSLISRSKSPPKPATDENILRILPQLGDSEKNLDKNN